MDKRQIIQDNELLEPKQYKFFTFITMIYLVIKLSTVLLIYKIICIGTLSFSASTLIIPFWFFLGTIIAETYGYNIARHLKN